MHPYIMIRGLTILLIFQSLGEMSAHVLNGAIPGPVVGLLLLLMFLVIRGGVPASISTAADGLLAHLSIFFIPAAVGVMLYVSTLASTGAAWAFAIALSTGASITVTALVLRAMSPRIDEADTPDSSADAQ